MWVHSLWTMYMSVCMDSCRLFFISHVQTPAAILCQMRCWDSLAYRICSLSSHATTVCEKNKKIIFIPLPVMSVLPSWEVVQASADLPSGELAIPSVLGLCAVGSARRLPAVEQCVGPGVPGGPRRSRRHPPGILWGRPQRRGQQCLWRARSGQNLCFCAHSGQLAH